MNMKIMTGMQDEKHFVNKKFNFRLAARLRAFAFIFLRIILIPALIAFHFLCLR